MDGWMAGRWWLLVCLAHTSVDASLLAPLWYLMVNSALVLYGTREASK